MEDYVTFEQAKQLKELGFNWKCHRYYYGKGQVRDFIPHNELLNEYSDDLFHDFNYGEHFLDEKLYNGELTSCPTLSQVQKWFRDVKGIDVHYSYGNKKWTYFWGKRWSQSILEEEYDTPLEALYGGIDRVIKYLKEQNNGNKKN